MHTYSVLRRPIVTEKSSLSQEQGKYVFEIAPLANKVQVREAVEKAFKVKVRKVNIVRTRGEVRRLGVRLIKTPDKKKALVTLKAGDTITLFEGA
jgi:large subunit ribosomal protein L23